MTIHLCTIVVCLLLSHGPTLGQDQPLPREPDWSAALDDRLESLHPSDPERYYLLGEEVAAEARTEEQVGLAQHLYVLAIVLGAEDPALRSMAASACIALSDITRAEADRRALRAIAGSLDARYGSRDWSRSTEIVLTDELAYEAATTLGMIRAGWGTLVRDNLKRQDIRTIIDTYSSLITGTANQNILPELERMAEQWPCPECHNERIVTKRHTGRIERRLCYTCNGNPGPSLSREQLIGHLRFEAHVLQSSPRSWGAQIAADLGAPLRDADINDLPVRFGVDPQRPIYRSGQWVAIPDEPASPDQDAQSRPDDS